MPLIQEPSEAYHASTPWSKSRLWRYATHTPYRAEFGKIAEKDYFLFGHAGHTAVLEPELLESSVFRATATRRGTNEWKANHEEAGDRILLLPDDYDLVMLMRDMADENETIRMMREVSDDGTGPLIERSCYATDPETGAEIKCRVDLYSPKYQGMMDLKFLADISDSSWSKDIGAYGYHVQDAGYNHVWNIGSGYKSEFMVFACFSKTEPPELIIRQLDDIDVEEGLAAYKAALEIAERCRREQHWPGQPTGVVRGVKMRDRDRRYTEPQWKLDKEAAMAAEGDEYE